MSRFMILIITVVLCSCASKPTVFVYGKYLDDSHQQGLEDALDSESFDVVFNTFDFPSSVTGNTLLYSLLLRDPNIIQKAETIAGEQGFPIDRVQGLTEGNHWYTKNALALFIFPDKASDRMPVFRADLTGRFRADGCAGVEALELTERGMFSIKKVKTDSNETPAQHGNWRYRQFPYLELTSSNSDVAQHYFEISTSRTTDQISNIFFIELAVLSSYLLPEGCRLRKGVRE